MDESGKPFSISGKNPLFDEPNFVARAEALDELELLRSALEAVDDRLFERLRPRARRHLRELIDTYVPPPYEPGYGVLDLFLQKLLPGGPLPEPTITPGPDMVYYQKTPAHLILELTQYLKPTDVFVDLGSGLGQPSILVNLLTNIPAIGVEIDPAFHAYATRVAEALQLDDVTFINADAQNADLERGTVFFLYTPFRGALLQTVLQRLPKNCRLITYGPCTEDLRHASCWRPVPHFDRVLPTAMHGRNAVRASSSDALSLFETR
ncbi:MAG TPA: class I SAM-dependent methyltransferase [Dinghuibacter sp.]|uniref:SAM-dependent methyltransferase n=1 Tax=Dinghuibacter sp. TaxID=2024697 RepID=UPI002B92D678|nr:class I SAM-dependent methyltransferase [Dinghuibacter sp.]HTJ12648.1 class I SAM-dependent methyltransferase [Dinghuibacter sp.]